MTQPRAVVKSVNPGKNASTSADIPAKRIVKQDTSNGEAAVALAAAATTPHYGVTMQQILRNNKVGDVQVCPGIAILTAGSGGLAVGDLVTSDASGKGIATTTDNHYVIGKCVAAADADADAEVELWPPGAQRGA